MLSDDIAGLLDRTCFAYIGTRTADLVPQIHRVYGWQLSPDRATLRCYVPAEHADGLAEAIADNGQAAVTVTEPGTAITFQLKGNIERSEAPTDDDVRRFEAYREAIFEHVAQMLGPEVLDKKSMLGPPAHIVILRILEVFDQTPGPSAGQRVWEAAR